MGICQSTTAVAPTVAPTATATPQKQPMNKNVPQMEPTSLDEPPVVIQQRPINQAQPVTTNAPLNDTPGATAVKQDQPKSKLEAEGANKSTTNNNAAKAIGAKAGAGPSTEPINLLIKEKLFSGDSFHIKLLPNREPFGNGLHIKGKRFTRRDEMAIEDAAGNVVAVCIQKFQLEGKAFKICLPEPVFEGQQPDEMYRQKPVYTYCLVKHVPFHNGQDVYMVCKDKEGEKVPEYEIRRLPGFGPRKLVMKKRDAANPAAMVEGHRMAVTPGSDPCLMICFCAICDEMDDDHRGGMGIERDVRMDMRRDMRRDMRMEMRGGRRW